MVEGRVREVTDSLFKVSNKLWCLARCVFYRSSVVYSTWQHQMFGFSPAYIKQSPFHALFTAVKLGSDPDASTTKTVLHSHWRLQGLSSNRTHTHTVEGYSFALWRGNSFTCLTTQPLCNGFSIQLPHKEVILFSLCGVLVPPSKYLPATCENQATTELRHWSHGENKSTDCRVSLQKQFMKILIHARFHPQLLC